MHSLFFFGSDQYSTTVLTYLTQHFALTIAPFPNLANLPPITPHTIGLSASFPHLFPPKIISAFGGRLYNLHPSLLPQYRNVAPVPYAISMGDTETGVTLFQIGTGIDNGVIVAQQIAPILSSDTSPVLLHRLFTLGAQLFLDYSTSPTPFTAQTAPADKLVFTRKLTIESGHLSWPTVLKLVRNEPLTPADANNPLLSLRLTHHPDRQNHLLHDLVRGLSGWEKVWTTVPTKKGDLRLTFESVLPALTVKLAGKPRPILWSDFTKYYL